MMPPRLLSFTSRRKRREREQESPTSTRSLFHKFRRILELNNDVLGRMAEMESALGGEYIFDMAFLSRSVREMSGLVHQVAYSLNAMTDDRYVQLYDRFEYLKSILYDILSGGLGPEASRLTMDYHELHWENLPLVGMANVCLATLGRMPEVNAVDGFAVTVTGCSLLLEQGFCASMEEAVRTETDALFSRRGNVCPLEISVHPAGTLEPAAGQHVTQVEAEALPHALLEACAKGARNGWSDLALGIHEAVPGTISGSLQTYCPGGAPGSMCLELAHDNGVESCILGKTQPIAPLESDILPKADVEKLPDGARPVQPLDNGMLRGSGLLRPGLQRQIAEAGIALERGLGSPQTLHLRLTPKGALHVVDVTPAALETESEADLLELSEVLDKAHPLIHGGESAQAGAAAGRVVHVDENNVPADFPLGAVAVARTASPQLAPLLRRAGALVTELGSTIGHLATVAREYRIPAIFGVTGALQALPPDAAVTVDASDTTIYAGSLDALLAQRRAGSELYAMDPEYTILRRLLQFIMPLQMTDAAAPGFAPENCRSYHDIIHFCHERAVEELLHVHSGRNTIAPHRLQMGIPLDLHVVDAGGGLAHGIGNVTSRDDILSEPMRYFLAGLRYAWDSRQSVRLSMRDVFSGMQRTSALLQAPTGNQGQNLAILATGYCNLSLHMGYHYNVIDAFMQENPNQNYIYYRFAGGFADSERKARRVRLIERILGALQFHVERKADLLTGRLKIVDQETMARTLEQLGMLTSFTRQLDISMGREASLELMGNAFHELVQHFSPQEAS